MSRRQARELQERQQQAAAEAQVPPKPAKTKKTKPPRRRSRATFVSVLGELLMTVGVVALLFVSWQLWIGDIIGAAKNNAAGSELTQSWESEPPALPEETEQTIDPETGTAEPVIRPEPADAEVFGVMRVPRFGADYEVPMAGGVSRARTLDTIGIGHYPGTAMPGDIGNFAVAGHRTTFGKPFAAIDQLRVNDPIIVETPDGWYVYRFRTIEYVSPDEISVIAPVPQQTHTAAGERYLTMTACHPLFSLAERIVAYSVFESFTPRASGPPTALTEGSA